MNIRSRTFSKQVDKGTHARTVSKATGTKYVVNGYHVPSIPVPTPTGSFWLFGNGSEIEFADGNLITLP